MKATFSITESTLPNELSKSFHDRKTPTEDMLSFVDHQDPLYSPTPGASVTSLSSPGSVTYTGHIGFPESQSMGSFYGQVNSCPSSSSLDVTTNFPRVNSTLSSSSEGHSRIMVPLSSNISTLSPCRSSSTPELKPSSPKGGSKPTVARRRSGGIKTRKNLADQGDDTTTHRRQKRLQRNRESARLSRRRRKVYLEELEERVNQLSEELDKTRREHVAVAVGTINTKRVAILSQVGLKPATEVLSTVDKCLSRTSEEMMVSVTFMAEQLKSFFIPPSLKFILWLTLQSDKYFRGGRAASERLSAARIGERVSLTFLDLLGIRFVSNCIAL